MGRIERRQALVGYVTGLVLDGERKSIEPMAARKAAEPAVVRDVVRPLVPHNRYREFL
jgi:hypothetical protein